MPCTARQTRGFIEARRMEQALHPPYSLDLAPSDFDLFDYLKERLQRQQFEDGDQLFEAIMALTRTIEQVSLQREFLEWMVSSRRCIDTNGEYVCVPNRTVKRGECFIDCVSRCAKLVGHSLRITEVGRKGNAPEGAEYHPCPILRR
jgi:hypothetical protein